MPANASLAQFSSGLRPLGMVETRLNATFGTPHSQLFFDHTTL
jgi:hypothetical protein